MPPSRHRPTQPPAHQAQPPAQAGLALANVSKTFSGSVAAVRDLSFTVAPGQFLAILGPSGCGKSTLLRMIAGLEPVTTGQIEIDHQPVADRPRFGAAFVFQDAHLLPWRSVLRNVELPLELSHQPPAQRRQLARDALAKVGLTDALALYPMQLSGGMRMRASLARALVTRPRLLLLDEPFAALDEFTRHQLDAQLLQLWNDTGMTVLFVTHSIAEAAFLAQRALVLSRRPASLLADLPIDLPPRRDADLRTTPRFAQAMHAIQQAITEPANA